MSELEISEVIALNDTFKDSDDMSLLFFISAYTIEDITQIIPKPVRKKLAKNAIQMSFLQTGSKFSVQMTDVELRKANDILSRIGSAIGKLINLPESLIKHVQFSEVVIDQASKVYESIFPDIIKEALKRSHIDDTIAWNFLIIFDAGSFVSCKIINESLLTIDVYHDKHIIPCIVDCFFQLCSGMVLKVPLHWQ